MKQRKSVTSIITLSLALLILVGYNFISAQTWTAPTGTPPADNTTAPVNVGSTYQAKNGDFGAVKLRSGYLCNASGSNCTVSVGGLNTDFKIASGSPTMLFQDSNDAIKNVWLRLNDNIFYILADRDNNGSWSGDDPWPMKMYIGTTTATNDFVQFANEVRAERFTDSAGSAEVTIDRRQDLLGVANQGQSVLRVGSQGGSGEVWAKRVCDSSGANCVSSSDMGPVSLTCRTVSSGLSGNTGGGSANNVANCASGEQVTGGGCVSSCSGMSSGNCSDMAVHQSIPTANGWSCSGTNRVSATAVCCSL